MLLDLARLLSRLERALGEASEVVIAGGPGALPQRLRRSGRWFLWSYSGGRLTLLLLREAPAVRKGLRDALLIDVAVREASRRLRLVLLILVAVGFVVAVIATPPGPLSVAVALSFVVTSLVLEVIVRYLLEPALARHLYASLRVCLGDEACREEFEGIVKGLGRVLEVFEKCSSGQVRCEGLLLREVGLRVEKVLNGYVLLKRVLAKA